MRRSSIRTVLRSCPRRERGGAQGHYAPRSVRFGASHDPEKLQTFRTDHAQKMLQPFVRQQNRVAATRGLRMAVVRRRFRLAAGDFKPGDIAALGPGLAAPAGCGARP
jgi:hypothetical protein